MSDENTKAGSWTLRMGVVTVMILLAAALRIAPHPWNFAPVGAMALFSGAMVRNRWAALALPLAALFAGDVFVGLYSLMPVVYASYLVYAVIGRWVETRRSAGRIGAGVVLGAAQFFLVTNFAVWAVGIGAYPKTFAGLLACYASGVPYFWNTLGGDALYSVALFGGFALAERLAPQLREPMAHQA